MSVTAKQRRVVDDSNLYHLACYEVWNFGKFRKLPLVRRASTNDRNHYQVVRR
jgi:hypothetical protein